MRFKYFGSLFERQYIAKSLVRQAYFARPSMTPFGRVTSAGSVMTQGDTWRRKTETPNMASLPKVLVDGGFTDGNFFTDGFDGVFFGVVHVICCFWSDSLLCLPPTRPLAPAAASPALVLSLIKFRSNWANAPNTWRTNLPEGFYCLYYCDILD
ncbi:hypothetical protein [Lacihabitans soyangensis]|uniref:hypothetical protein n=1 Tax=Lacihabitans soyangensis TaxID=869394 RepID=UPI00286E45CC|nr:hypothetical protein [Lacihabitans soyangensis]